MVSVLDRKIYRDLWVLRGQVLTIALLIAAGVAVFIASLSNYHTLLRSQAEHYASEQFADVFATLERAPNALLDRVRDIPGVGLAEGRVVAAARLDWPGEARPLAGRLVSLPRVGQPTLNRLVLASGVWPDPSRPEEVLINVAFAAARGVVPGDGLAVVLEGRSRRLRVVGTAYSPEFVFASRAGDPLPDSGGFAIIWMGETAAAGAFDMVGAFSDLVISLAPGANAAPVIDAVDRMLAPYGGRGAYARRDHPSHRFLEDELTEQRTVAVVTPILFFGVAAFLMAIVIGRVVEAQRGQIAALKALGFPTGPILRHYVLLVGLVALSGAALGVLAGDLLARAIVESYRPFFVFPAMEHRLEAWPVAVALLASLALAVAAAWRAVARVVFLPVSESLRQATPTAGRRFGAKRSARLSPRAAIAWRGMIGRPIRTGLSILGVALAVPLVVLGQFWFDALGALLDLGFERVDRADAFAVLNRPVPAGELDAFAAAPGALLAEGQRIVPVRLSAGHRSHRIALTGLPTDGDLRAPREADLARVPLPREGLLLGARLAGKLGVRVGDEVTIEVLDGARPVRSVVLAETARDAMGYLALMERDALNALLREAPTINAVAFRVDPTLADALMARLSAMPAVEAVSVKATWLRLFETTVMGLIRVSAYIVTGFGLLIAIGVVYNSARVAFQERAWELASLRVLGFTRAEVSHILFAELAAVVALGVPIGVVLARWLVVALLGARHNESFDLPAIVSPSTLATAALFVAASALASACLVRRRVDRLDIVSALKARE